MEDAAHSLRGSPLKWKARDRLISHFAAILDCHSEPLER